MLKRPFHAIIFKNSHLIRNLTSFPPPLSSTYPLLSYQSHNFFTSGSSRNNRNNNNNNNQNNAGPLMPIPSFPTKLTQHDVEVKSKGTTISVQFQGKTISYDLGKTVKGATLGDTHRYVLMCTCSICGNKIVKTFTKKAYHSGVVIIVCEKCENYHLIADNLGWFRDKPVNIEDFAEEKGDAVLKIYPDNNMKKMLNNIEFVGEKHSATIESDELGLPSSSLLQVIENIQPPKEDITKKILGPRGGFGRKGLN